jgi:hypothetical protein
MVDINVSVFKDAAEAIDKLVDVVSKLVGLLGKGSDLIAWTTARTLRKKLGSIHSRTTSLWIGQGVRLRNTLADFIAEPRVQLQG